MYVRQLNLSHCKTLCKSNEQYVCQLKASPSKKVDKSDERQETGRLTDPLPGLIL